MTGIRASAGAGALAACLVLGSASLISSARAQDAGIRPDSGAQTGVIHFELPAQPLAQALQAYSRIADVAVVALNRQLEGHLSTALSGDYARREALSRLLADTGFEADFTAEDAAIIVPSSTSPQRSSSLPPTLGAAPPGIDGIGGSSDDRGDFRAYAALVQTRLTEALCESPQTRPGSYRLVVQLRIGETGSVVASKVVGTTGQPARDAAIERAMRTLAFDAAPPAGLPEPVTILMHPDGNGVHTNCGQRSGQRDGRSADPLGDASLDQRTSSHTDPFGTSSRRPHGGDVANAAPGTRG
jgi:hypothetical protein